MICGIIIAIGSYCNRLYCPQIILICSRIIIIIYIRIIYGCTQTVHTHKHTMAHIQRIPVYGTRPPCATPTRLEEWRNRLRSMRLERSRKPEKLEDFVVYEDSDEDEDNIIAEKEILRTSYNFVDYVRGREMGGKEPRWVSAEYGSRHILTHEMFKEYSVSLSNMNKVFCSQWLSDRQVVFGTKCNKVILFHLFLKFKFVS